MCGRLEYYLLSFSKLSEKSGITFPLDTSSRDRFWCPLLRAAVLDHIASGLITKNYIVPSPALEETYLACSAPGIDLLKERPSMAVPFRGLQSSGFWHLRPGKHARPPAQFQARHLDQLRDLIHGAV